MTEEQDNRPSEALGCELCGGPHGDKWFAPSPLWNAVMRGGSINGPWVGSELVCPSCFISKAEDMGIASGWKLTAAKVNIALENTTPSGRVWDDTKDLWVDPSPAPASGALSCPRCGELDMMMCDCSLPSCVLAPTSDGYAGAFYQLAELMGLPAQNASPKRVWEDQMLPRLKQVLAPSTSDEAAVEAVARAIEASMQNARINEPGWRYHELEARAAIAAYKLARPVEGLVEALRECRRAISHGADEPRRNVREIVDTALANWTAGEQT